MGFKTFVAGVLSAADVNNYLMKQANIACTSGTRPASPQAGMEIYETDTGRKLLYNGSAWIYLGGSGPRVWGGPRSTDPASNDLYSSGSFSSLLSVALPSDAQSGAYLVLANLSLSSAADAAGNLRALVGATNISNDCPFNVPGGSLAVVQPWLGTFQHAGGAATISVAHKPTANTVVWNAATEIAVLYTGGPA